MLNNYYTLRYLAAETGKAVKGLRITGAFTQERDEIVIQFDAGSAHLVLCCKRETPAMYLHPNFARKKRNSADVLGEVIGKIVERVAVVQGDRRVLFELQERRLEALLFGNEPNVLLLDQGNTVIDAFRNAKNVRGKLLSSEPERVDFSNDQLLDEAFQAHPQLSVLQVLKKAYPHLGSTLAMEILHRSSIEPGALCVAIGAPKFAVFHEELVGVLNEISRPEPRVYVDHAGMPTVFSLITMKHRERETPESFDDVHKAIRFFLSRSRSVAGFEEQRAAILRKVSDALARDRRSLDALEKVLASHERADAYEESGHAIMKHLQDIRKGDNHAVLPVNGGTERIALDTKLSPAQNAQAFFEKAKSARRARVLAESRVEGLRQRISTGTSLTEKLESADSLEQLNSLMNDHNDELSAFSAGKKAEERAQIPFRVFTVDGGFEVWAGKSSQNNDLLTTKHAKPDDLWFHARGSSGSHVVLRVDSAKGEPGKRAKEQAASIAAYYSKMKNAKMIPVAMTEKKFVRKPKGAPAGTVVLEREKVLFVEAKLPDSSAPGTKAHQ